MSGCGPRTRSDRPRPDHRKGPREDRQGPEGPKKTRAASAGRRGRGQPKGRRSRTRRTPEPRRPADRRRSRSRSRSTSTGCTSGSTACRSRTRTRAACSGRRTRRSSRSPADRGRTVGRYTVEFPDELRPKLVTTTTGTQARWLKSGQPIVWLVGRRARQRAATAGCGGRVGRGPGGAGRAARAGRRGRQRPRVTAAAGGDGVSRRAPGHRPGGRSTRPRSTCAGGRCATTGTTSGSATATGTPVRQKYPRRSPRRPTRSARDRRQLMLGELNGSHLGFTPAATRPRPPRAAHARRPTGRAGRRRSWTAVTAHLGVRFDPTSTARA